MNADSAKFQVVVQLQCQDVRQAAWELVDRFGFKEERGYLSVRDLDAGTAHLRLRRLDQVIELIKAPVGRELHHGAIDHLALATRNVGSAVAALRAKWGRLDPGVTPDGPMKFDNFGPFSANFAFVFGPDEARIEFCNLQGNALGALPQPLVNVGGHHHFGVRCRRLPETTEFYRQFGFEERTDFVIPLPEGAVEICFMEREGYLLEVASTPDFRDREVVAPDCARWSRLIIETTAEDKRAKSQLGPNGEYVEVRTVSDLQPFRFDEGDLT